VIESLIKLTGQKLILPYYHAVSDTPMPHLQKLHVVRTVKQFNDDLEFFLKHYQPISVDDLVAMKHGKMHLEKPSFLLSFDDGLKEVAEIIQPILQRKGIPAISFVNTNFAKGEDIFFRYKASLLHQHIMTHCKEDEYILKLLADYLEHQQAGVFEDITEFLLNINYESKDALDIIAEITDYTFSGRGKDIYMNVTQLQSLAANIQIGAHSVDHPEFRFIDEAERAAQVTESIKEIHEWVAPAYRLFSFPFTDYGVDASFFNWLAKELDISFGCAGLKKEKFPFHLQRIWMEQSDAPAQSIITKAYTKWLIKAPFGRNLIHR
jgi:peptidoglycan/xylan/chitin deacetylase (PgdA/CDA1 family)